MPRIRRFSSSDRFLSRVPEKHFHKLDVAINEYMRKESGFFKKALPITTGILLLGFFTNPSRMIQLFKSYIVSIFQ